MTESLRFDDEFGNARPMMQFPDSAADTPETGQIFKN